MYVFLSTYLGRQFLCACIYIPYTLLTHYNVFLCVCVVVVMVVGVRTWLSFIKSYN